MNRNVRKNFSILLCTLAVMVPATLAPLATPANAADAPARPHRHHARKDRVYARDLVGVWLNTAYLEALRKTRMPMAAEKLAHPIAMTIEQKGRSYPFVRTDFERAVLLRIIDIQPDTEKNGFRVILAENDMEAVPEDETTVIRFRGQKDVQGRFAELAVAEPEFGKGRFQAFTRIDGGLGPLVNDITVAGKYTDEQGRHYEFSSSGDATLPDGGFKYEVRLRTRGTTCDMIQASDEDSGKDPRRIGYRWTAGKLELFDVTKAADDTLTCGKTPVAVLKPEA
ncbi:MAG: hypothetical protein GC151_19590 [Betaproteobacteria bacterium]|nr:hypothetical protein [Betaproteobacteria bacterium]